ncbi:MAG: cobalt-precorrin-6A reductase [Cyanophyceae cyanobacterium]
MKILILGGTGDALALIKGLQGLPEFSTWVFVLSLAGRTRSQLPGNWQVRIGGFGGIGGLKDYLQTAPVDLLVDATHPFADQISYQAWAAADALAIPYLRLTRSPWQPEAGDRWIDVANHQDAAAILSTLGQRIFLSIGRQELGSYAHLTSLWFLMRTVEQPGATEVLPPGFILLDKGPFFAPSERSLLQQYAIEVVVSKNSGGAATYGKLAAARELQLPVVMIQRPNPPPGPGVDTVEKAIAWILQWNQSRSYKISKR